MESEMTRNVTDGALSAEKFEALSPKEQLFALLGMIDRYIDGAPGHTVDSWHAAKISEALEKIEAGEVMAAAHNLALADQKSHGEPELVAEDVSVDALRKEAHAARKRMMASS